MTNGLKKIYWTLRDRAQLFCKDYLVDRARLCSVRGQSIHIHCASPIEAYRAGTYGTKEPETLDWLDRYLKPGDVFFDIGANIGLYSLYAAKRVSDVQIFSFEPEALNFSRLMKNVIKNQVSSITPINLALSDRMGLSFLQLSQFSEGAALHQLNHHGQGPREGIMTTTLDDLVFQHHIPPPHLLKIDVDGVEDKIFAGAQKLLEHPQLRTILVEINFDATGRNSIDLLLKTKGFRPSRVVRFDGGQDMANVIYER